MFTLKNSEKYDSFYGIKAKNIAIDDFYKFYLTQDTFYAVKIAAEITNEKDAANQLGILYYILKPWVRRILKKRTRLEAFYEYLELESEQLLSSNKSNMKLPIDEIEQVIFLEEENKRTYPLHNKGDLILQLKNGPRLKFILYPTEQDLSRIQSIWISKGIVVRTKRKLKNA